MKKTSTPPPVSERRHTAERRVRENTAWPDFQDLVDNAVQGILVHRNFRPLYANDAFAEIFGYDKAADIMALPLVRSLVPADLWAQVEQDYDALLRGAKKPDFTRMRGVRKDGTEIWSAVAERVVNWHGAPAVQITVSDITKRVASEQSLLINEQRLRAMLEILPVPVYISRRRDAQILFVNRKTCLLFQQSAGRLLHDKSVNFFVDQEERTNLLTLLETIPDVR